MLDANINDVQMNQKFSELNVASSKLYNLYTKKALNFRYCCNCIIILK